MAEQGMVAYGTLFAALAGFLTAAIYGFILHANNETLRQMLRAHNLSVLFEILTKEWLDREFRSTTPPLVDGKQIRTVREAKRRAEGINRDEWDQASEFGKNGWENALAYEIAIALERIGAGVFAGAIPVRILLNIAADRILEDWLLCRSWIDSYHEQHPKTFLRGTPESGIHYHRRHARWLVLLAAVWMNKYYPDFQAIDDVAGRFGGRGMLLKHFKNHSEEEQSNLDSITRKEISSMIGVRI